ncbi:MAG: phosphoenolpyruvate synthase [Methylococcales bacterium]|jgi:pyruvate, water dikinase|nr:phosphoenolpyruvate synthase [Methylococcales bacterium]MBT7443222.1 phosphoenolpyruvate synthase [Methylococcales bacterium]
MSEMIRWLQDVGIQDIPEVGGKNASLGEMIHNLSDANIRVPGGFATTADAFHYFINSNGLEVKIQAALDALDIEDLDALSKTGNEIRQWVMDAPFPPSLEKAITDAWQIMIEKEGDDFAVAVRSSATAEDLPDASFAGQQETYLNVRGLDHVLNAIRDVYASLFNDRAISYRVHQGFAHEGVALSAGIQRMIRSDIGSSGVMFTLDTESGFTDVVFITSSYGLGETVVQGAVNPDEFYVHKPTLAANKPAILKRNLGGKAIKMIYIENADSHKSLKTVDVDANERDQFSINDADVALLAEYAVSIEKHYGRAMDIEWAKDGNTGELFIVQARPETVNSQQGKSIERFQLKEKGSILIQGRSIGQKIGAGTAKVIESISEMNKIKAGDVLVTDMTDPDWEPIMKKASAIVTNRGGRTCHAAIIARELGIPAVVGCNDATSAIADGTPVTVSCAEGDTGYVYQGELSFERTTTEVSELPEIPLKVMMNVGNPERAFSFASIPNAGVGLARLEFIINRMIGIHPKALLEFDKLPVKLQTTIFHRMEGFTDPVAFYVAKLVEGISTITAAFSPKAVIVRMSDFKSNEYANLIGGERYEPKEENPMIGFRGASRYVSSHFVTCFALECQAIKTVRETMGLDNLQIMIPFVRTLEEAASVIKLLEKYGLKRGENGLKVMMMCEIPSNVILANEFLEYFDGFSIGSNDLTQLTLGLDRDSSLVADKFDERNPAIKILLKQAIEACKAKGKYIGICGQGPSDHPDLAEWLLDQGIESVSLNPDTVVETWLAMAKHVNAKK